MPKYYRFRATTPTRRVRQNKDKDKEKDVLRIDTLEKAVEELVHLTSLLCAGPSWYRRRTAWRERERPTTMAPMRPLATTAPMRPLATTAGQPLFLVKLRPPNFADKCAQM